MNGVELVQWVKLGGTYLIFACLFAEMMMRGQGRRWRRARVVALCVMAACGGFVGMALL